MRTQTDFELLCECIWQNWLTKKDCTIFTQNTSTFNFQFDFAPEPYLIFKIRDEEPLNPLYILTTNPGDGIDCQRVENMQSPSCLVRTDMAYYEAAQAFAAGYQYQNLVNSGAKNRIKKMLVLAEKMGKNAVFQIESIPFHSIELPNKKDILEKTQDSIFFSQYVQALRNFLADKDVFVLSAASSKYSLSINTIRQSAWLSWQAGIIGFDKNIYRTTEIKAKADKITSLLLSSQRGLAKKMLFLTMGSNNLPNPESLKKISDCYLAALGDA